MTVYCCPHCRRTLTFRPGVRIEGLHEGDWSGCPGCGANMCVACGDAAGGHCPDCGAVVVANRMFARWLRPEGAWRDSLEYFDPVQLVAHATADVVDTLVATATARRADFAGEVATLVARHALGGLAYVVHLRLGRESRLPLPWFANLERVARRLAVGAPDRWAATIDAMILIEGLAGLTPERLALPWPADLLHHEEAAVRDAAAPLLDRVGASSWSPFGESPKSRAELEAALADRDQHPWDRIGLVEALAALATNDDAARARVHALIGDDQEFVDVRVHAACALAIDAPGDAPPAARLSESAAPMLRAAGHVLGVRARADDPSPLLRYLATSRDCSLSAWCEANPALRESLRPPRTLPRSKRPKAP